MNQTNKKSPNTSPTPASAETAPTTDDKKAAPEPTKVTVDIFGTTYHLKTDSDPDELRLCAKMVDHYMKLVSTRTRSFSGPRIGVLAALELAEEYCRLKKDYDELLALLADK